MNSYRCMWIYTWIYIHVYMYTYVHICIHIPTWRYIHTYTYHPCRDGPMGLRPMLGPSKLPTCKRSLQVKPYSLKWNLHACMLMHAWTYPKGPCPTAWYGPKGPYRPFHATFKYRSTQHYIPLNWILPTTETIVACNVPKVPAHGPKGP